jgi:hypothetical protein
MTAWNIRQKVELCALPRYPGGYPSSRILLSHGGGSSSCLTKSDGGKTNIL